MSELKLQKRVVLPVTSLKRDPANPNVMSKQELDGLRESLRRYGYLDPIVIDQDNVIANGEHRLEVLVEAGYTKVECVQVELKSDEERKLLRQTLNKLHGTPDRAKDADEMKLLYDAGRLPDLSKLLGQNEEMLLRTIERSYNLGIMHIDDIPELPKGEPKTKPGQVWKLGEHRLMCGDSTKAKDVKLLMGGALVDQLNTDPPYGVDYGDKNAYLNAQTVAPGNRLTTPIAGDQNIKDYRLFYASFMGLVPFAEYNTAYVFMQGPHLHDLRLAIADAGLTWSDYLVWVKGRQVLGRKDYQQAHEFIVYGWRGKHKPFKNKRTTILEYQGRMSNDIHLTQKPSALILSLVREGSPEGGLVYDPFLGSGTTLIACEQSDRKCYGLEIDPRYCDVIIARWERLTGQKAELMA